MIIYRKIVLCFIIGIVIIVSTHHPVCGQENRKLQPHWWFGGTAGPNFNFYSSEIRTLNSTLTVPNAFSGGSGTGLYLAPLVEFRPDPIWGGMFSLGVDSRNGSFDDIAVATDTTASLSTSMNYLSLEPSLRISPFPSGVYFFIGPRVGFNVGKSFTYQKQADGSREEDWSNVRGTVLTGQFGAGYDFLLAPGSSESQLSVSPFLALHFGQGPRSLERWTLTTLRLGVAVKYGSAKEARERVERELQFSVQAPRIIPIERKVKETFPMRNYVFFDEDQTDISSRYIRLTKEEAASFREEQLLEPQPKDLTGRSRRQLTVYHNILNILGDRLRRYLQATVTLIGSSENGITDGKALAESIKRYLVDTYGISEARVRTEGRTKPEIPSVQPGATRELDLVRPEDRRVDITSASLELLQPVQIISLQEDPFDSDVLCTVSRSEELLASWSVEFTDQNGNVKRFGPFTRDQERIPGRSILGDRLQGTYQIVMSGQTKSGQAVRKEESIRLVRSDEPEGDLGLRFSILFEFDQSKTVATYERFLTNEVAPLIPEAGSVIIHGHTDIIGEESHNLKLSRDRAHETMNVFERALAKAGKRRVRFDTYGFGEDIRRAPFENNLPEERFYNRTVIIDIVPE
ncbi:MAG: outer membrane beta-barrel protein [Ignavibacteriae bacterium]|nr:outer membrane beta-barrel protein [Ignavibacteriota bacterium]